MSDTEPKEKKMTKTDTWFRDSYGDMRFGWMFPIIAAHLAFVMALIALVAITFQSHSCARIGEIRGIRAEFDAWGLACYLEAPDGRMVEESKWYGYEDPAKQDVDLTIRQGGGR